MAIITFKIIQNAKVGGVLENLRYLLQDGDRDFLKIEEEMNEKMKVGKLVIYGPGPDLWALKYWAINFAKKCELHQYSGDDNESKLHNLPYLVSFYLLMTLRPICKRKDIIVASIDWL